MADYLQYLTQPTNLFGPRVTDMRKVQRTLAALSCLAGLGLGVDIACVKLSRYCETGSRSKGAVNQEDNPHVLAELFQR
eukprot:2580054-Pyramimonas_sp.AAC.1